MAEVTDTVVNATVKPNTLYFFAYPVIFIAKSLYWIPWSSGLSGLAMLVVWPFRILSVPLISLVRTLLFLLSPPLLIISTLGALVTWVFGLVLIFEPLYIFFGTAATLGLVAGVVLAASSSVVTVQLGMHEVSPPLGRRKRKGEPWNEAHLIHDSDYKYELSSSNEAEWQWLETSPSRRSRASGLLSQTIHEEEDDTDPGT